MKKTRFSSSVMKKIHVKVTGAMEHPRFGSAGTVHRQ